MEKNNLLDVDTLANELLKTKSEDELKKVLLPQLLLLDHKKRKDKTIEEMKQVIDMLDRDKNDLIKCQKGVVRALNKKINSNNQLNITVRGLEDEINKINGNINYYQSLGDSYKSAMNELSQIY
jgi:DhnA family fructose-bisphosphate aldolase class Ia